MMGLERIIQTVCKDCSKFGECKYVKNIVDVGDSLEDVVKLNRQAFKENVFVTINCSKKC